MNRIATCVEKEGTGIWRGIAPLSMKWRGAARRQPGGVRLARRPYFRPARDSAGARVYAVRAVHLEGGKAMPEAGTERDAQGTGPTRTPLVPDRTLELPMRLLGRTVKRTSAALSALRPGQVLAVVTDDP